MPNICDIHANTIGKYLKENFAKETEDIKGFKKLQQYNDPTAHFRMIREEIKKAAQDGKTKLQFPTGETAMKIEGLGEQRFYNVIEYKGERQLQNIVNPDELRVGKIMGTREAGLTDWVVTKVLGNGKFKAVPEREVTQTMKRFDMSWEQAVDGISKNPLDNIAETFDISGKVDTNNPIYKFYEKDVAKYLNKFGGKKIVDDKGVSWIEIPITKEQGTEPVVAFKKETGEKKLIGREESKKQISNLLKRLKLDIDVNFVSQIITQDLENAYGAFFDNTVSFEEFITDTTVVHEIGHAIFRNLDKIALFKGITREELYDEARQLYGEQDNLSLEESIMEDLEAYANKSKTFTGKIKQFLERIYNGLQSLFGKRSQIQDFYSKTLYGKAKEVTKLAPAGYINQYLKGDVLTFEGFKKPKFLNQEVSQRDIENEFNVLFKKYGEGIKIGRADVRNKMDVLTTETQRREFLKKFQGAIVQRAYFTQGLEAIRNNIPPKERFAYMKQLAEIKSSSVQYLNLLEDIYQRKAELDLLDGTKKVTAKKRQLVSFLRNVNNLDSALIRDVKQQLGFKDVYKQGDKKGQEKPTLKPITQFTSTELDQMIAEIKKRIQFRQDNGYVPTTTKMLSLEDTRALGEIASKTEQYRIKGVVKEGWREVSDFIKAGVVTLENRLKFAPEIYHGLRRIDQNVNLYLNDISDSVKEFRTIYKKLSKADKKAFDALVYSQEWDKARELLTDNGLDTAPLDKIKSILDDLYSKLTSVGVDVGYLKDYFPRFIKQELQKNPDHLAEMIDNIRAKMGRIETNEELSNKAATFLRGFNSGGRILLSDGRFVESREIDKITTPEILNLYEQAVDSLDAYVEQAIRLYEEKKFFNKLDPKLAQDLAKKDYERAISNYIERLQSEGKITGAQNNELQDVLKAYFYVGKNWKIAKASMTAASVIGVGKLLSAVPQITEISQYIATNSLTATQRAFMSKMGISMKDIGIDSFFEANEIDLSKISKVLTIPMRVSDLIAGRVGINILYQEVRKQAKEKSAVAKQNFERLFGKDGEMYMNEFANLPKNIKGSDLPGFAKDVLNAEIRKYRVAGRLEKSEFFVKSPTWGLFKSFVVKMANEIVIKGNQEMALAIKNNDKVLFAKGVQRKLGLVTSLVISGATASFIRDVLRGNEPDETEDYVWTAFLNLFGLSYYGIQNFNRKGVLQFVIDMFGPAGITIPLAEIEKLRQDIKKDIDKYSYDISDYKTLRDIPLAGDVFYYLQNQK